MNRHTVPAATANAKRKVFLATFVMRILQSCASALGPNAHPRSMLRRATYFLFTTRIRLRQARDVAEGARLALTGLLHQPEA